MLNPQLNKNGELQHLLTIEGLPTSVVTHILDTASSFVGVSFIPHPYLISYATPLNPPKAADIIPAQQKNADKAEGPAETGTDERPPVFNRHRKKVEKAMKIA